MSARIYKVSWKHFNFFVMHANTIVIINIDMKNIAATSKHINLVLNNNKLKVNKYAVFNESKNLKYASDHFPVYAELKIEK